jgi:hypothetical protein
MVATDRPKSLAIFFRGMLFFCRHVLNAFAKLARMSQQKFDFGATKGVYAKFLLKGRAYPPDAGRL